jgi:hypothetical protein
VLEISNCGKLLVSSSLRLESLFEWVSDAVRRTKMPVASGITGRDAGQLACCWASGIEICTGRYNFRATGSTNSWENGGTLEQA